MNYDVQKITDSLYQKTQLDVILWEKYDYISDNNMFSFKYFSTIPTLDSHNGYVASFNGGFVYLVPDYLNTHGLFLQSSNCYPPLCLNYDNGFLVYNENIEKLYDLISKPFDDLDNFINQITN